MLILLSVLYITIHIFMMIYLTYKQPFLHLPYNYSNLLVQSIANGNIIIKDWINTLLASCYKLHWVLLQVCLLHSFHLREFPFIYLLCRIPSSLV